MITTHEQIEIEIDGNVVKVDKGLENTIRYLNDCGYKTLFSCIGSVGGGSAYFCFSSYEHIFKLIKDKHMENFFNAYVTFGVSSYDNRTAIYMPHEKLKEFEAGLFKVYIPYDQKIT